MGRKGLAGTRQIHLSETKLGPVPLGPSGSLVWVDNDTRFMNRYWRRRWAAGERRNNIKRRGGA